MTYKLKFFEEVKTDIIEAKDWYREKQDGLEIRFANSIKAAILQIQKSPTSFSIRYKTIRIAHPKIFPFNIHFYLDDNAKTIIITAIVHNRRHPDIARKRI